jgi:hypothetical protein
MPRGGSRDGVIFTLIMYTIAFFICVFFYVYPLNQTGKTIALVCGILFFFTNLSLVAVLMGVDLSDD